MTTPRWRGTLIYTGTLATIGTVAFTRFGPLAGTDQVAPVTAAPVASSSSPVSPSTGSAASSANATPSPSDTATPAPGSTTSSTVTVAGSVSQTRYGPVQVSVTFTGSTIVDVRTLQSPSAERESVQIAARSTPTLAKEVLAAQSATIDTVSGATYTSEGYRESVQSAIDQVG
ncbi:Uncharacterized protein, contains FMN-binding domain [Sanguibacter gelidistatuariae]|uniref:Uncharacterized protein, contains FMN-binding domain n=1 Tax=Sanguibacter gelidistatuariae TaxID=1814289 RepID=A0A1G6XLG8_9MICO|nr:FMN-binding protein [Sanguibacter gelidistatuariae]SDD78275.1 Uncharacterized protein, contains FMN-binding domain [Sanguibacter gelidistatuariae]